MGAVRECVPNAMRATLRNVTGIVGLLGLLVVCSCGTTHRDGYRLPRTVVFDEDTGRGRLLILKVRLESGEEIPFLFDTGTAITCFDQSLEPKLGRCLGPATVIHFGVKHEGNLYPAPRLFLGDTLLRSSGTNVATFDFRKTAPDGVLRFLGILGMDVLKNYCVQLDFDAHRLRFFKTRAAAPRTWGRVFPLLAVGDDCPVVTDNFLGAAHPVSVVDSGFNYDGWLTPACYQEWMNQPPRWDYGQNSYYYGSLGGEVYLSLNLKEIYSHALFTEDPHLKINGIGLRFLARHRVTFDFPNHRMYLRRTSVGPRVADRVKTAGDAAGRSAFEYVSRLRKLGQLPGWSKADKPADGNYSFNVTFLSHPDSDLEPQSPSDLEQATVVNLYNLRKKQDPCLYVYELRRSQRGDAWNIEKAWKTDADGRILEHLLP